ncbi:Polyketide synthase OS=Streptomyces fumanus OX=67302 GN=GCM10018772_62350 PE=4 SV=1 [Streptomyces fumanus]
MALEHPRLWGGLVDLPEQPDTHAWTRVVAVLAGSGSEDQAAVRADGILVRRLVRAPARATGQPLRPVRLTGTVLVTGGTGGLGARVARWAAENGAEHLVLTSRSGPDAPGARDLADRLGALGPRVTITACDMADRAARWPG